MIWGTFGWWSGEGGAIILLSPNSSEVDEEDVSR